jgi:hypothetical protein
MNRLIIEIVAGIAFVAVAVYFLEHRGAEKCIAADKAAVQEQEVHNAEVHGEQTAEVKAEAREYHDEISRPVTAAPVIRVCARPREVPAASPTGPVDHEDASLRGEKPEVPTVVEWDSEPIVRSGRDADVQIAKLERYINVVCLKR